MAALLLFPYFFFDMKLKLYSHLTKATFGTFKSLFNKVKVSQVDEY